MKTSAGLVAVLAVVAATAPPADAHTARHYWLRPYAELRLVTRQVPGLPPILDARCQGRGKPRVSRNGARMYGHFGCRVLTNVETPAPWVFLYLHVLGSGSFRVDVS